MSAANPPQVPPSVAPQVPTQFTDGTEQGQRHPAALDSRYFQVDEQGFEQRLMMVGEFAAQLKFANLDGTWRGVWRELLRADDAYVFASILSVDGERLSAQGQRALQGGRAHEVRALIGWLVSTLDGWVRELGRSDLPPARALYRVLSDIVRAHLVQFVDEGLLPSDLSLAKLQPVWRAGASSDRVRWHSTLSEPPAGGDGRGEGEDRALRSCLLSLLNAVTHLQGAARARFAEVLGTGAHDPALGLLFAFLKLTERAQEELNGFTHRHLNFYYRDVLGLAPRAAQADRAVLVLDADLRRPDVAVELPAGKRFLGEDESGRMHAFRGEHALNLRPVEVACLNTLRFERDPLISPERELGYVSAVVSEAIEVTPATAQRPLALFGGRDPAPAFARPRADAAGGGPETADFGVAIASPTLTLGEGERRIVLGLYLDDPGAMHTASELLQRQALVLDRSRGRKQAQDPSPSLSPQAARYMAERVSEAGLAPEAVLKRVLEHVSERPVSVEAATDQLQPLMSDPDERLGWFEAQMAALALFAGPAPTRDTFFRLFGRAFSRYLLTGQGMLGQASMVEQLLSRAREVLSASEDQSSLRVIEELLDGCWEDAYYRYCRRLFSVALSAEDGWYAVDDYSILPPSTAAGRSGHGDLQLQFTLPPDAPAIVPWDAQLHGGAFDIAQPMVRLLVRPDAALHPISILDGLLLRAVTVDVRVRGLTSLVAYTNVGTVSARDQFAPFGPLPRVGAFLAVGSAEAARKPITCVNLHLDWGNLPREEGGFDSHYGAYPQDLRNESFTVATSVLRDGEWLPQEHVARDQALFDVADMGRRPQAKRCLRIRGTEHLRPMRPGELSAGRPFDSRASNGFVRLTLTGPSGAFGHADYPAQLATVLSENMRERKASRAKAVPNPPYTPVLNRVTLDYEASTRISLQASAARSGNAPVSDQALFHVLPAGAKRIYPGGLEASYGLLPTHDHDGHLAIGLRGGSPSGRLTLLFRLADDALAEPPTRAAGVHWYYLVGDRWQVLAPRRVMADTTEGFLTSGIITLDVPRDIDSQHRVMGDGLYWLRVSTDAPCTRFARLIEVAANALSVVREIDEDAQDAVNTALPSQRIDRLANPVPGISRVRQPDPSSGGRPAEPQQQFETRVAERLRHRQRAVQPWDYERLVLEAFPEVFKAKCFSALAQEAGDARVCPGQVMVVVVPANPDDALARAVEPTQRKLQGAALGRIQRYLQARAPAFATIEVRNPVYERIQVRCTVKLALGAQVGEEIARINRTICAYISPWEPGGYGAVFGWRMRRQELEAAIRALEAVEFVTDFSMLHITEDRAGHYRMDDTARGDDEDECIGPRHPWSLAVPMAEHYIEVAEAFEEIPARATGIGELQVGSTLIVADAQTAAQRGRP